jgi:molecular chaperone GrpE
MSRRDSEKKAPPPPVDPQMAAGESPAGQTALEPAEDELTLLRRDNEELRDKNLRLLAEMQNSQKRVQREKQESSRFAEADFARELLVVLDDLNRTQQSVANGADSAAIGDGMRITVEHFLKVLGQRGIRPIETVGRPFDPTYHEALLQQPSSDQPAGTVLQELARGYTMHERVLRAAKVIVSSGPASAQE